MVGDVGEIRRVGIGGVQFWGTIMLVGKDRGTDDGLSRRIPGRFMQLANVALRSYDNHFLDWVNPLTYLAKRRRFFVLKSRDGRFRPGDDIELDFLALQRWRNEYYNEAHHELIQQEIDRELYPC